MISHGMATYVKQDVFEPRLKIRSASDRRHKVEFTTAVNYGAPVSHVL